jgi:hypothetical protein
MGSHMTLNIVFESCLYDTNFHIHMFAIMWFQQQAWRNKVGWQANFFFLIWPYFYYDIFYNARSHKNTLQQNWMYLKIVCLNMHIRKFLSEFMPTTLLVWSVFSIYTIQKTSDISMVFPLQLMNGFICHNLWKEPQWGSQAPSNNIAKRRWPRIWVR